MNEDASTVVCELGPLVVRRGKEVSPVPGRRSAAVLALLTTNRTRIRSSDELLEAGWGVPDRPTTARHSLANVLSRFRHSFGASFIESSEGGYRLGAGIDSDRANFLNLTEQAGTQLASSPRDALVLAKQALALWRGTPWPELDEIDELRIDQSRLMQAHYRVRELSAEALLSLGRPHEAVAAFSALTGDDPINEAAWNGWARALAATDRRVEALRVIGSSRTALAASGLLLGHGLVDTESKLLAEGQGDLGGSAALGTLNPQPLPLALATRPNFVLGRDSELEALTDDWGRTPRAGQSHVVVGEAGIGKTTLLTEFAHRASEKGANILHGSADDVLNVPFQPYVMALKGWIERSGSGFDDALLDSLLGSGSHTEPGDPPTLFQVLDAFHRAIEGVAAFGPTLLLLEDLHWAAPQTVSLTRALARRLPRGVLLVATMRPHDETADGHLDGLLSDAKRLPSMTHTTLGELSQPEVSKLVDLLAPGHCLEQGVISDLAGGNPLLVTELAAAVAAAPAQDAGWSVAQSQLDMFGEGQRYLLELAATLGESFWAEDLSEASDSTLGETLALLHEASRRRLLSLTEAKTWKFRHGLVRDVVLSHLTPLTLAQRHLRVADTLAARNRPGASEVAQHYVAAVGYGGRLKALNWLALAAREATQAGDHERAAQHWSQTIEFDREAGPESLVAAHMSQGAALVSGGFWERSHEPFEAAAALAIEIGDHGAHARSAIAWIHAPENHSAATQFPEFILATRDIVDDVEAGLGACLAAILAIDAMDHNRIDEGLALHERARSIAAQLGDVEVQAFVRRARLRTWWDPAQLGARRRSALDLASAGKQSNSPNMLAYGLRWQAIHGIESGDLEASGTLCEQLISHGNRRGEPFHMWFG